MSPGVLTTRAEALRLYREILRTTRAFTWADRDGEVWGRKLGRAARREFEEARHVGDQETIVRLLVVGRDSLMRAQNMLAGKRRALQEEEEKKLERGT